MKTLPPSKEHPLEHPKEQTNKIKLLFNLTYKYMTYRSEHPTSILLFFGIKNSVPGHLSPTPDLSQNLSMANFSPPSLLFLLTINGYLGKK